MMKFICGYTVCDPHFSRILLGGLPPLLKVKIREDASGQWLENSISYSVGHADASRLGGEAVLAMLPETLFVETLGRCIARLPREQTGWLAFATRKSAKPWLFCIACRLIHGQWLHSRMR
jgi:Cupin